MAGILGGVKFPCVPGHELSGVVEKVGSKVTKFKVGDHVGVGCMVDSCLKCKQCKGGQEQKCGKQVGTYQAKDQNGRAECFPKGSHTLGGYTTKMVVHEHFAINIPKDYPLECAGPVMCAGITMFDPLKVHGVGKGSNVGIVGMGGLGILGVRIAKAMGCKVTAISRSSAKRDLACSHTLGADSYVVSSDPQDMNANRGSLDLILNTIPQCKMH